MDNTSQVVIGDIPESISAMELALFLENRLGGVVDRCRLKKFSPPYYAYPEFSCNEFNEIRSYVGTPCAPHAFVHFATARTAQRACKLAEEQRLRIGDHVLKVQLITDVLVTHRSNGKVQRPWRISNAEVELGSLISMTSFLVSWKGPSRGACFEVDPLKKRCHILFSQWCLFRHLDEKMWMKCNCKLEFLIRDIWEVRKENEWEGQGDLSLVVQFRFPPRIFFRTADDDIYHATPFNLPDDGDPWVRTLDFTPEKSIGRCHAYRISVSPRQKSQFQDILDYFEQQELLKNGESPVLNLSHEVQSREHRRSHFFHVTGNSWMPFEIMFLINCLVHKGIIKSSSLTSGFYNLLNPTVTPIPLSVFALTHIYSYKTPVFDAEKRLKKVIDWSCSKKLTERHADDGRNTAQVRRFFITPTKAYCLPAETELSNRVLRHFVGLEDRFLRVSFLDENFHPLSSTMLNVVVSPFGRMNGRYGRSVLYDRVRGILLKGFFLCGRNYEFLAFSSNQLRDHSAWFFARTARVNADGIRRWMGEFDMPNVAKCAARMGQCFSSTFPTLKCQNVEESPDVWHNEYCFSDGIGMISPRLALECAAILKLEDHPPSAYQIRYAGFKGVVVNWSMGHPDECKLTLRPSMKKFHSNHDLIEVITWSRYLPCFLNRQIITLLSALKVPSEVFINLQDNMVQKLDRVLEDSKDAFEVLSSYCSGDMYNVALEMLEAGFHPLEEPHLYSMLHCIRASYLEEVLSKARIYVKNGRWLLGCMDESGILEYGQCFVQVSVPFQDDSLPENSMGLGSRRCELKVITGSIIMAKNPCLHPGDIRILQAVDHPSLHHLVDCFIMPQKGERPHSNEASGSDLDGDIYFVCWDPRLIPPGGKSWEPMQYIAPKEINTKRIPQTEDLVEFFVKHMISDHLGKICNAHVVHADSSDLGALDPKCLELALLAAIAVDSPKTGMRVNLPAHLRPKRYPDFMDKEDKPSYRSEKILGYLFRRVKKTANMEIKLRSRLDYSNDSFEEYYDRDLEVDGYKKYLPEAWRLKQLYDAKLTTLMDQFDVSVEGEVVTGHVITLLSKYNSRRKGDLKDRLRSSYTALRNEFRDIFRAPTDEIEETELERKAFAWYYVTYNPDFVRQVKEMDPHSTILLSFPWIALEHLARIKIRKKAKYDAYYDLIRSVGELL